MSRVFSHEIFKIHHRKWPEIHVFLNFLSDDEYGRICLIKNFVIWKNSNPIIRNLTFDSIDPFLIHLNKFILIHFKWRANSFQKCRILHNDNQI